MAYSVQNKIRTWREGEMKAVIKSSSRTAAGSRLHEDLALLSETGCRVFRVSIDWARIFPTGRERHPVEEALQYYDDLFTLLIRHGIEPLVEISCDDLPRGLVEDYMGWQARELIDHFMRFISVIFARYNKKVHYWLFQIDSRSRWVPYTESSRRSEGRCLRIKGFQKAESLRVDFQALHHQFVAGAKAVMHAHDRYPDYRVGAERCFSGKYRCDDITGCNLKEALYANIVDRLCPDIQIWGLYPGYFEKWMRKERVSFERYPEDTDTLVEGRVDFCVYNYRMNREGRLHLQKIQRYERELPWDSSDTDKLKADRIPVIEPWNLRDALMKIWTDYSIPVMALEKGLIVRDIWTEDGLKDDICLRSYIYKMREAADAGVKFMDCRPWGWLDLVCTSKDVRGRDSFFWLEKVFTSRNKGLA